jgi:hypothetical protein
MIDTASNEVKAKEAREIEEQHIEKLRKKDKKKRNKMRGKGKIGREMENMVHQDHKGIREKNKILYKREYDQIKKENDMLETDIGFLDKLQEKFDPMEAIISSGVKT